MSATLEKLENNKVKLTVEVNAEQLESAIQKVYMKSRGKIALPGFRKGKAPRQLIEAQYGSGFFFEDAVNELLPDAYGDALDEHKLDVVSRPEIDVTEIDKAKGATLVFEVYVKPVVTLSKEQYSGLEYEKPEVTVADEEIDAVLESDREKNSRVVTVTDRAVEDGDTVKIDFEGFVDGEAFPGGKGEDYDLIIGSHSFIDNFEDQLIGTAIDAEVEVNVNFPAEYHAADLAGKPALFKVKVKSITKKELPELDDELAQDVSEFDTLDEYKADIKERLTKQKAEQAEAEAENRVLQALADKVEIDIPDAMVESEIDRNIRNFSSRLAQQGLQLEQYLMFSGQTEEALRESSRENSLFNVKSRLLVEAVAETENIEVSDEEYDEEIGKLAEAYNMTAEEFKKDLSEDVVEGFKIDLKMRKAAKLIVDAAIAKEAVNE